MVMVINLVLSFKCDYYKFGFIFTIKSLILFVLYSEILFVLYSEILFRAQNYSTFNFKLFQFY